MVKAKKLSKGKAFETANPEDCKVESHCIGLIIPIKLVEENRGVIWIESEPQKRPPSLVAGCKN